MTPSISDFMHGLRRLWWLPVLALLIGGAISGFGAVSGAPSITTTSHVLFKFKTADQGQDSAGSARSAEAEVADDRLTGYVQLVMANQQLRSVLLQNGIDMLPTTTSPSTGQVLDDSARVVITATVGGVVEVRLYNEGLSAADGIALTNTIASEVSNIVLATDALQDAPSLLPAAVVTEPQAVTAPPSMLKLVLPALLLLIAGLIAVYGIVWAQNRIWTGRDVEERLGAQLLGESAGGNADSTTIALALTKDRGTATRALLVPVGTIANGQADALGEQVVSAWAQLKHPVTRTAAAATAPRQPAEAADHLEVIVAPDGLDADALRAAVSADIIGLIIGYGDSRYRELTAVGRSLAKITDAEIAVIGLAKPSR